MQHTIPVQLEELAKLRHEAPSAIIAQAVKIGLSRLYVESVLEQFLKKRISRNNAIRLAGLDAVKLAEQQKKIVENDLTWGLGRG